MRRNAHNHQPRDHTGQQEASAGQQSAVSLTISTGDQVNGSPRLAMLNGAGVDGLQDNLDGGSSLAVIGTLSRRGVCSRL